jgi:sterol desaturase/sphingolipid hydroxylase (fatty acid hydroxylase superfamily)
LAEFILAHEPVIRLTGFVGIFTAMALWEILAPRRSPSFSRWRRWPSNLAIVALNTALLRILLPGVALTLAIATERNRWGLLNAMGLPVWSKFVLAIVLLDLAIYLQHVMFHAVPVLWRFHRMHHSDLDFDVTTGSRFHIGEILLSAGYKFALVSVLGVPAASFVVFEVALNATSMFNHSNVHIPAALDPVLRWVLVTPDMHRVHHSVVRDETNSNFGFNLSCWDRLLGTYRAQPSAGH